MSGSRPAGIDCLLGQSLTWWFEVISNGRSGQFWRSPCFGIATLCAVMRGVISTDLTVRGTSRSHSTVWPGTSDLISCQRRRPSRIPTHTRAVRSKHGNAVTAIDETWDEQQGKMVPRKQLQSRACFIATAAYGDIDAPEVEQLRRFRDKSLMTNPVGRGFVKAYYRISPPFARLIARKPHLRMAARKVLDVVRRKAAL